MGENNVKKTNYVTSRYSLFKENQLNFNDVIHPITKEEVFDLFLGRLKKEKRIQIPVENHTYVMYYSGTISENRHLLKFAKEIKRKLNEATLSDIRETEVPDYPWCLIIVDVKNQIFLISKNSQISSSINTQKNFIAKAISSLLTEYQVSLQLELITNKNMFWESISGNSGNIRFVELSLISPNILGQSYSTTQLLNELKKECNNDSLTWRFENSQGKLKIPFNSNFFKDILEYISNGCGSWKIKTKSGAKPITSEDQAIEFPLDNDMFTLTASQKVDIQNIFTRINALENENHKWSDNYEDENS